MKQLQTKNIHFKKQYQENIVSLQQEEINTSTIITNIYERFINESNANSMQYALNVLQGYRYIPSTQCAPPGRYLRYIDTTDAHDMKLKLGGFVISDNGYSVTYKNHERFVKLNKRHCILFVLITDNERVRCALSSLA